MSSDENDRHYQSRLNNNREYNYEYERDNQGYDNEYNRDHGRDHDYEYDRRTTRRNRDNTMPSHVNTKSKNHNRSSSRSRRSGRSRRQYNYDVQDKSMLLRPITWYNHSATRLMALCVIFSLIAYEVFILRAPLSVDHNFPSNYNPKRNSLTTNSASTSTTVRVPSQTFQSNVQNDNNNNNNKASESTDQNSQSVTSSSLYSSSSTLSSDRKNDDGNPNQADNSNPNNKNDNDNKPVSEVPADAGSDTSKSPTFRPLRRRHRVNSPPAVSSSSDTEKNAPASALALNLGAADKDTTHVIDSSAADGIESSSKSSSTESDSTSSLGSLPDPPPISRSSQAASHTGSSSKEKKYSSDSISKEGSKPEKEVDKAKTAKSNSSGEKKNENYNDNNNDNNNDNDSNGNESNNSTKSGSEPGVGENFWQWFQDSKGGGKESNSSSVHCPDEDTKRLCSQFYKYLRKYKVRSIYDVSCSKNTRWIPTVLQKAGRELWGLKYYCNVLPPGTMRKGEVEKQKDIEQVKEELKEIKFVEYSQDIWWKTGFNVQNLELLFAWDTLSHVAYGRVWSFFVKAKSENVKYILIDNYPQLSNDPSPNRQFLNVRRHPFRFPTAKELVQNVTEPNETEKRQLLFYETAALPENIQ